MGRLRTTVGKGRERYAWLTDTSAHVGNVGCVLLYSADKTELFYENYAEYEGAAHTEAILLDGLTSWMANVGRHARDARIAYIHSYYAPCSDCVRRLTVFSGRHSRWRFKLGFHADFVGHGRYSSAASQQGSLEDLMMAGWRVVRWSGGNANHNTHVVTGLAKNTTGIYSKAGNIAFVNSIFEALES